MAERRDGATVRSLGRLPVRPWPREALFLVPLLLVVFVRVFTMPTDPDYWWHVRVGQYIYETRSVPFADIFSFTASDRPWVAHEWLAELLFYVVARHFGYVGNVVLFGLMSVVTSLAIYVTCRREGAGDVPSAILVVLANAMLLGTATTNVRPQMITLLLFALSAHLLTLYRQGVRWVLGVLPPIFVVWVNVHGGYAVGLALLGLTIVGELVARRLREPAAPLRPLLLVAACSFAATLLNPRGFQALVYPLSYFEAGNAIQTYIAEWQPPRFDDPYTVPFAVCLLLTVILGVARRPVAPTPVLWAAVFTVMGLLSMRHIPLYAVVVMPLLARRLQTEVSAFRQSLDQWERPVSAMVAAWLTLVAVVAATLLVPERREALQLGWGPVDAQYPVGAVAYLRARQPEGNLFNEYVWGGYLIHELYPERRVFIDGRIDVYGNSVGRQYHEVVTLGPRWREALERYDVRLVLVRKESPLALALATEPGWREVYRGAVEQLFERDRYAGGRSQSGVEVCGGACGDNVAR